MSIYADFAKAEKGNLASESEATQTFFFPFMLKDERPSPTGRSCLDHEWIDLLCVAWNITTPGASKKSEVLRPFPPAEALSLRPCQYRPGLSTAEQNTRQRDNAQRLLPYER